MCFYYAEVLLFSIDDWKVILYRNMFGLCVLTSSACIYFNIFVLIDSTCTCSPWGSCATSVSVFIRLGNVKDRIADVNCLNQYNVYPSVTPMYLFMLQIYVRKACINLCFMHIVVTSWQCMKVETFQGPTVGA